MADIFFSLLSLYFLIDFVLGDYCSKTEWSYLYIGYRHKEFYCPLGCCGSLNNEYCCIGQAGYIVGLVFAGIAGLAFIIALVCCCLKKSSSKGRVVEPIVTTTTIHSQYDQGAGFVGPTAPPSYSSVAYTTSYTAPAGNMPPPYPYPAAPVYGYPQAYEQQFNKPSNNNHEPTAYSSPNTYSSPTTNNFN